MRCLASQLAVLCWGANDAGSLLLARCPPSPSSALSGHQDALPPAQTLTLASCQAGRTEERSGVFLSFFSAPPCSGPYFLWRLHLSLTPAPRGSPSMLWSPTRFWKCPSLCPFRLGAVTVSICHWSWVPPYPAPPPLSPLQQPLQSCSAGPSVACQNAGTWLPLGGGLLGWVKMSQA